MGKLIVELPDTLHVQLKKQAAADRKTLKVIVTSLLGQYLEGSSRSSSMKKMTGLCGAWKGRETPERLLAELRTARRWTMRGRA